LRTRGGRRVVAKRRRERGREWAFAAQPLDEFVIFLVSGTERFCCWALPARFCAPNWRPYLPLTREGGGSILKHLGSAPEVTGAQAREI
jgi:hypothetical protein